MDHIIDQHVSQRVKESRVAKGVDAHTVAKWLGLEIDEYNARETGEIAFNLLELIELSWKLNVPTSAFTRDMPRRKAA